MRAVFLIALPATVLLAACGEAPGNAAQAKVASAKPALTVTVTTPQVLEWSQTLGAGGNVAAWQESVIGAELGNYRITEVRASVGDAVRKGQILARIDPASVESELAEVRASVAEAEAMLAETRANHERAQQLSAKGFYSAQQNTQTQTAAETALARLNAAKARLQSAELKRSRATVQAPDDGLISTRNATVGTLVQPGQELFRLIRGGRLEWRAEVTSAELARIRPGQGATISAPTGAAVEGVVRAVAPTVDPQTRAGLVYVDLPPQAAATVSAGMFVRGEFRLGSSPALTLPQAAVLLREGFAYVYRVDGDKVAQVKVSTASRVGDIVEIAGIDPATRVVASGVGFLADGDTVRIVDSPVPAGAKQ